MNQRKCTECGTWNGINEQVCSNCNKLIDPDKLASAEREIQKTELEAVRLAEQSRLDKWFTKFKHSDNPFHRFIYFIGSTLLTIYMGFISFFIWLIALISG